MDSVERISWFRPSCLPGVELLSAADDTHAWAVFHERYEACALVRVRGSVSGRYRGRTLDFQRPGLSLLEPGETHTTTLLTGGVDFHTLCVSPHTFQRAAEEQGLAGQVHFRLAQLEDGRLSAAIQGLAASIQAAGSPLEQQSWLVLCLQGMQGYAERTPRQPSPRLCGAAVRQAMDCLRDRYQEPVDLEELADLTGVGRFSLVHAFSAQVGLPPHAYQIRIRIERARVLLERGVPPTVVAAEVGFSDQSHFHRHFKNILHVTPGEYARSSSRIVTFP